MPFLASLHPLLRGASSVTITLSAAANDATSVLICSKLDKFDPDATDKAVAELQAALVRPLRIVIPAGADLDAEFDAALNRYEAARTPVMEDLQIALDALSQAQQAAKAAAKKPAPTKPDAKPAKAAATPAPKASPATGEEGSEDVGDDAGADQSPALGSPAADTTAVSTASPAPAAADSLFD